MTSATGRGDVLPYKPEAQARDCVPCLARASGWWSASKRFRPLPRSRFGLVCRLSGGAMSQGRAWNRRSFLRIGGVALGGFWLTNAARAAPAARARACILLYMDGGPSHIDLWDLKPDAPT